LCVKLGTILTKLELVIDAVAADERTGEVERRVELIDLESSDDSVG
jgi:hypothetical protein